jgi:MFS transporter, Spinster family, sphingosine-1-phosphate transporter
VREPRTRRYLLLILLTVFAFNAMDRLALGLLLQDIKSDLHLSDTQLGLLTGIAFALFYSSMGIPIARWADRGDRITILSVTTFLWSMAVALCGVATSFLQLLLIRIGAAVGEAACNPVSHSLIAQHFSRAERPQATAIYMLGGPLSVFFGYFLAGWLNELYGWRLTFILLGLPGVALAILIRSTCPETRHPTAASDPAERLQSRVGLLVVCATLWRNATFRHLLLCFAVTSLFSYGVVQWQPAFFVRSHGLSTGELGGWLTLVYGLGGLVGTYWGGRWAARLATHNERLQLEAMAVIYTVFAIVSALTYVTHNRYVAFAILALTTVASTLTAAPLFSTIQTLLPDDMRATAIAFIYLFANLIGMGLGPLALGALSDSLQGLFGQESLRYAMIALSPGYLWSSWHLWRASRTVMADLAGSAAHRTDAVGVTEARSDGCRT